MTKNTNDLINKPWILQRADPYVYLHSDGYYYFTASVPAYDQIVLRKSKTLEGLADAEEITIWEKHLTGIMGAHIWAPELHYLQGKWYIYFAAGESEEVWNIRPYVLMCEDEDPITGKWIEQGRLQKADDDEFSFEAFSLDVTVFENKDKLYCIWAEKVGVGKQISNLYIAEMENPCKLKTVQVLLTTPDYDWERIGFWVNEGAAILKRDENIYLTYSASETGIHYCIGMLKTTEDRDLLDPRSWQKERDPVLVTDASKGIYGPGHNSFTKGSNGEDMMIYHARTEEKIEGNPLYNPNRHAFFMTVKWDAQGNPQFIL